MRFSLVHSSINYGCFVAWWITIQGNVSNGLKLVCNFRITGNIIVVKRSILVLNILSQIWVLIVWLHKDGAWNDLLFWQFKMHSDRWQSTFFFFFFYFVSLQTVCVYFPQTAKTHNFLCSTSISIHTTKANSHLFIAMQSHFMLCQNTVRVSHGACFPTVNRHKLHYRAAVVYETGVISLFLSVRHTYINIQSVCLHDTWRNKLLP